MKKQKKWSRIMIGTLLVLVIAIGGTAVLAQSQDDPTITPPTGEGQRPNFGEGQDRPHFGERGFPGRGGDTAAGEDLAEALGITVEELQAAQEAAHAAALAQAVTDGLITQEQADQMSQFGGRFMRGGHFDAGHLSAIGDREELLANELGISVEALQTAQEEVQAAKMAQLVEDGVLTKEQADLMTARHAVNEYVDHEGLRDAAQAAYETAVQQALDAGEITQEQADQLLSDAAAAPGFGRFGSRGGHDRRGSHGRPGGFNRENSSGQFLPNPSTSDTNG